MVGSLLIAVALGIEPKGSQVSLWFRLARSVTCVQDRLACRCDLPPAVEFVGDGPGSHQRHGRHCKVMTMTGHDTPSAENVEVLATSRRRAYGSPTFAGPLHYGAARANLDAPTPWRALWSPRPSCPSAPGRLTSCTRNSCPNPTTLHNNELT